MLFTLSPMQIIVIIISLFAISRVIIQFKNNQMAPLGALFWIILWSSVIILDINPSILSFVASNIGVGRGVDVIIYLSIIVLFYLLYRTYAKLEKTDRDITKLVREIAILERVDNRKKEYIKPKSN